MAAAQAGDAVTLARVIGHQRAHLLRELHSLAGARALGSPSPVVTLLLTAAELHARADLGVVDAAERDLGPEALEALKVLPSGTRAAAPDQAPAHAEGSTSAAGS